MDIVWVKDGFDTLLTRGRGRNHAVIFLRTQTLTSKSVYELCVIRELQTTQTPRIKLRGSSIDRHLTTESPLTYRSKLLSRPYSGT